MYFIYNLAFCFGLALFAPWLAYRALRGRLPGIGQRLGLLPQSGSLPGGLVVWIHAVSLGEAKVAAALVKELKSRIPEARIVITSSTRTGWNAARQYCQAGDTVLFPPLDLGWICRRFFQRLRPNAVLVMETELWPNLFREAKRSGVVLLLVNGRLSDRAFPRYRASRFLWRRVLAHPDGLFLQTLTDAERFKALGAPPEKVRVAGNLKFAVQPTYSPMADTLREKLRDSEANPVIVAGSTMPGEEQYLLATFLQLLREFPRLWMVLAPRHPERFASVAEEVRALGIPLQLRSQWQAQTRPCPPGVLLLDSIGELGAIYQLATVAYVGGTMVPTGGHNILEPAYFARPIVIGPYMDNFREITDNFLQDLGIGQGPSGPGIRTGAVVQVQDDEGLTATLRFLLRNPDFSRRLGESAYNLLKRNLSGVTPVLDELDRLLTQQALPVRRETNLQQHAILDPRQAFPLSSLASGAASLWTAGAWTRARFYRSGLSRQRSLRTSVISVGNISWGGTGKTPFTIWLAGRLQAAGLRVSILTRGYRRTSREQVQIIPPGTSPQDVRDAGDEVQLYLRHLNAPIGVSASRYEAGRLLEERFPVDVHLLDDGFQHLGLARALDLVLVDAENPWGARPGLPRLLREGTSALGRAQGILLTRCELASGTTRDNSHLESLRETVQRFNPRVPCFTVKTKLLHFVDVRGANPVSPEKFHSRRPVAFCALGNPQNFFRMLEEAGIEVAATKVFPDHHRYQPRDLHLLEKWVRENRADCLLTTEKDLVNLPETNSIAIPLCWAAIEPLVDEENRLLSWIWRQLDFPPELLPLDSQSASGINQVNLAGRI